MTNQDAIVINESGMNFGPFPRENCFCIENSQCHDETGKEKINIAEFLLLRQKQNKPPTILVVEAKSGRPDDKVPSKEIELKITEKNGKNEIKFKELNPKFRLALDQYVDEIRIKLTNGFLLGMASCLGRCSQNGLPETFKNLDFSKIEFCFILVIKRRIDENTSKPINVDLAPLTAKLRKELAPLVKSWKFHSNNSVLVLNDQMAQKQGLITP
ncbi:MAG: hypothetical protein RIR79_155 [Pseudomonadota bacterium]|jgi:hypothetical protein